MSEPGGMSFTVRDAEGRIVSQGDEWPEAMAPKGPTAAGASPWATARDNPTAEPVDPTLEADYRAAYARFGRGRPDA